MAFPRKILVPIKAEPRAWQPTEVQEILNWVSPTSYWSIMDNQVYAKERTLKQLMNPPIIYHDEETTKTVVGTGNTLDNLRLKVLDEDVAQLFIQSVREDGLAPNSNITIVIQYEPGFEGLGSLFDVVREKPMSMMQPSNATWYRHSCWDSQVFSKSEAWIKGFQRTEEEAPDTEDVLSK